MFMNCFMNLTNKHYLAKTLVLLIVNPLIAFASITEYWFRMLQLCEICASRLSGCNDYALFADGASTLPMNPEFQTFLSSEMCHLCLGILRRDNFAGYKSRVRETVHSWPLRSDQAVSDVQLLISGSAGWTPVGWFCYQVTTLVPSVMTLVEKVVVAKLKELLPDSIVKSVHSASTKEILKTVCCTNLFGDTEIKVTSDRIGLMVLTAWFSEWGFRASMLIFLSLWEIGHGVLGNYRLSWNI